MSISKKFSELEKTVLREIGDFYLSKYLHDDVTPQEYDTQYQDAAHSIYLLGITQIEVERVPAEGFKVTIRLHRPGLLIGVKGSNIEALQNHLSKALGDKVLIHIVEELLNDYLYPQDWTTEY